MGLFPMPLCLWRGDHALTREIAAAALDGNVGLVKAAEHRTLCATNLGLL